MKKNNNELKKKMDENKIDVNKLNKAGKNFFTMFYEVVDKKIGKIKFFL